MCVLLYTVVKCICVIFLVAFLLVGNVSKIDFQLADLVNELPAMGVE